VIAVGSDVVFLGICCCQEALIVQYLRRQEPVGVKLALIDSGSYFVSV
jgi:hypothetical protein